MIKLNEGLNKVSNSDYHADKEWLSSSNLKLLLKDPEQFYQEKILGIREAKTGSHFDEGSLTHSMILEPHMVNSEFSFFPGLRKVGDDFQKFSAANPNKIIISKPQKIRVDGYVKAFKKNPAAVQLVSGGEAEFTICKTLSDVKVKVRCDYINVEKGYILDVKTTSFPSDVDSFRLTMSQWGYDLSAALYAEVAAAHYGKPFDFYFVVIDKKQSVCEVYKMSQSTMSMGLGQIAKALRLYKKCKATGLWAKEAEEMVVNSDYEILEV